MTCVYIIAALVFSVVPMMLAVPIVFTMMEAAIVVFFLELSTMLSTWS
jgi:hypothetical protein